MFLTSLNISIDLFLGYGNIAPVTPAGKVFCIIFAIVGIPFTLSVIADVGQICANVVTLIWTKCQPIYQRWLKVFKTWNKDRRKRKGYRNNLGYINDIDDDI